MKSLFFQENISLIDLYKNDVYMAEKTIVNSKETDAIQVDVFGNESNEKPYKVSDDYTFKTVRQ